MPFLGVIYLVIPSHLSLVLRQEEVLFSFSSDARHPLVSIRLPCVRAEEDYVYSSDVRRWFSPSLVVVKVISLRCYS